jgi:anti-anti-sigma factor
MLLESEKIRNAIILRPQDARIEDMRLLGEIRGLNKKFQMDKINGIGIDLSDVRFINSTGISAILGCSKHMDKEHKGFVIFNLQTQIYTLFKVSHLMQLIVIRKSQDEALHAISSWRSKTIEQLTQENYRPPIDKNSPVGKKRIIRKKKPSTHDSPPTPLKNPELEKKTPESHIRIHMEDESLKVRLDPLFDVIRQLRQVAAKEGLDVDLNTNLGQFVVQFVDAVKRSINDHENE